MTGQYLLVAQHIPDAIAGKDEELIPLFQTEMPDLWDGNHHLHMQLQSAGLLSKKPSKQPRHSRLPEMTGSRKTSGAEIVQTLCQSLPHPRSPVSALAQEGVRHAIPNAKNEGGPKCCIFCGLCIIMPSPTRLSTRDTTL